MNRSGQVFFVTLMIALCFIILALAFAPVIRDFIVNAQAPTSDTAVGLDCSNSSISSFDKASCLFVDAFNPYFIGFLIAAAGAIIAAKLLL